MYRPWTDATGLSNQGLRYQKSGSLKRDNTCRRHLWAWWNVPMAPSPINSVSNTSVTRMLALSRISPSGNNIRIIQVIKQGEVPNHHHKIRSSNTRPLRPSKTSPVGMKVKFHIFIFLLKVKQNYFLPLEKVGWTLLYWLTCLFLSVCVRACVCAHVWAPVHVCMHV